MNTLSIRVLGTLLVGVAVACAPALSYAQHSFGGGGHMGGGGGGGGHVGGGMGGGGGGHYAGGGGHFAGGPHYGGGFYGGGHYAAGGHYVTRTGAYAGGYSAGPHYYSGARGYGAVHYGAGYTSGHLNAPVQAHGAAVATGAHVVAGHGYYPGYNHPWVGGYWHGAYWPRCWYYPGYAWYLPWLPFGYATYWWAGVPYYYYNNLYYTYSAADSGYVVTQPPMEGEEGGAQAGADQAGSAYGAPTGGGSNIYLYPRNGQTDQQMQNDRYECHSWAVGQTGFDPTQGGQQSGNGDDYRRAMISCLDARGYSAR